MWILTEDYELVDLNKFFKVYIEKIDGTIGVWADSGDPVRDDALLMSCDQEETAWYLTDAIRDALENERRTFSVAAWLDAKIEAQMAPAQPKGELEMTPEEAGKLSS
jgi:hypothetical protein